VDRLPTRANLGRRGVILGTVCCPLYQDGDETAQHLISSCKVFQRVWDYYERWIGNVTVRHEDITSHFQSFHLMGHSNRVNSVWKGLWIAIVSVIWSHRNKAVFNGGVVDAEESFSLAQLKGWLWIKYILKRNSISYSDWHFSPLKCVLLVV